jgi:hypothetical protein
MPQTTTPTPSRVPLNFRFVGFEEHGRTIMLNVNQIVALEDITEGTKPRLEVYLVGDAKDQPRYVLSVTLEEFFKRCKLL